MSKGVVSGSKPVAGVPAKDKVEQIRSKKKLSEDFKLIQNQWREFSQTLAFKDLMDYAEGTVEMLTAYAQEGVMPSPINKGEEMLLDNEKRINLLTNARGCAIIVSYIRERVSSDA